LTYFRATYLSKRFYLLGVLLVVLFSLGHFSSLFFFLAKIGLLLFLFAMIMDFSLLFFAGSRKISLVREIPERLSNGDENIITIFVKNDYAFPVSVEIIDEIPQQFQKRDFTFTTRIEAFGEEQLEYTLQPFQRGEYDFGKTHVYAGTVVRLFIRRFSFGEPNRVVAVYPSFLKMRQYELLAISNRLTEVGIKRIRKLGTHSEFDQIKEYVSGDNYRTINWKATAKRNRLMVNQFQEERSQQIINIIDKGRSMKMPFNGMTLLDYAINSTLVLSNISLQKYDKAGLITFNKTVDSFLPPERKKGTITLLLEMLYKQETHFLESDFSLLATYLRRKVTHRSLIILYTNFHSPPSVKQQINYLKNIAKHHLLLVVLFENTEVSALLKDDTKNVKDIYTKTIAEKYNYDKRLIIREFKKHGILSIYTRPEALSANIINKYLELKNKGMI
jgi:uncharacterized protein (DUF58 family)